MVMPSTFPPNIMQWAGGSILGSIRKIDSLCTTKEEYIKNDKEVKDRYWEILHCTAEKAKEHTAPIRPTHTRRTSSVAYKKRASIMPSGNQVFGV